MARVQSIASVVFTQVSRSTPLMIYLLRMTGAVGMITMSGHILLWLPNAARPSRRRGADSKTVWRFVAVQEKRFFPELAAKSSLPAGVTVPPN